MKKPSFLERLTGAVPAKDYDRILDDDHHFGDDEEAAEENEDYNDGETWQDDNVETERKKVSCQLICIRQTTPSSLKP